MNYKKNIPFQLSGLTLALLSTQAQAQSSCAPGSYDEPPIDGICVEAPVGTYVPNAGATSYIEAPAGSFVNVTGATAATLASPGYFVSTTGASFATPATTGHYVPTAGAVNQIEAPVGTFVSTSGASAPTPAPAGRYVALTGQSAATLAPAGSFVNVTGASAATPAPPGTYVPFAGASAAIPAPPGEYVPFSGAIAPLQCPNGGDTPFAGSTACRDVSQVIDDPELVGPEFELLKHGPATINIWAATPGNSTSFVNILNTTDDIASPSALVGLTILDITISDDVDSVFSLDSALFDGGGNFIPVTIAADYNPWSLGWAFGIGLTSAAYGQFTAQLDILTDQNAQIGSAGDLFSFQLVGEIPEPAPFFLLSGGLLALLGWNFRMRNLKTRS